MTQSCRLAAGGLIDRSVPITFTFNGTAYQGYAGDSLASALLANGVRLIGRSFKYHRPRGVMAAGVEDPGALVQLETGAHTTPNLKATEIALYPNLQARSVNAWPSVGFDLHAINGRLSRFLPAGFYYKTFFGSPWAWHRLFEPMIRRAAGWGRAPDQPDPDIYDRMHTHCDVLVVGGGPSGLMAARAAGESGARVILAELDERFGGSALTRSVTIEGGTGPDWSDKMVAQLMAMPDVRLLPRTTVFGYYDDNYLCALERRTDHLGPTGDESGLTRQRVWHIRAKRVVLATGAHERPLVFAGNDRPGIMLASAVSAYINRWAVLPGRRAVLFTNNDRAYESALDLLRVGATVSVVDSRSQPAGSIIDAVIAAGAEVLFGQAVTATKGGKALQYVRIQPLAADQRATGAVGQWRDADLLAVSGGYSPVVHLFSQSQGKLAYDDVLACFRAAEGRQAQASAGACNAAFGLEDAMKEGFACGAEAAQATGFAPPSAKPNPKTNELPGRPARPRSGWSLTTIRSTWARPSISSTSRTTAPPRTSVSASAKASRPSST